ncbi:MAG: DUF1801 domain-containing protein [Candidatus Levybacteria bacterium]|nr:DUF1801 domain-containing protein [Candidatus Levybacteria bacterium]
MPNYSDEVNEFIKTLNHPFKTEIIKVREIILHTDEQVSEHIKWNAPSFGYNGDDRITFRLHPPKDIQLIFHRGAKVKDNSDFIFEDTSGLMHWVTKDRATVAFKNMVDIAIHEKAFTKLVKAWLIATRE